MFAVNLLKQGSTHAVLALFAGFQAFNPDTLSTLLNAGPWGYAALAFGVLGILLNDSAASLPFKMPFKLVMNTDAAPDPVKTGPASPPVPPLVAGLFALVGALFVGSLLFPGWASAATIDGMHPPASAWHLFALVGLGVAAFAVLRWFSRSLRFALFGCLAVLCVAGCAEVTSAVDNTVTPANITTACGWVQTGDTVFKTAETLSPKIAAFAPQEAEADKAATTLCTQPYPTDLASLLAKLLVIVAQVQGYAVAPAA